MGLGVGCGFGLVIFAVYVIVLRLMCVMVLICWVFAVSSSGLARDLGCGVLRFLGLGVYWFGYLPGWFTLLAFDCCLVYC